MDLTIGLSFMSLLIGLQTFWMSRSLGRVESSIDGLTGEMRDVRERLTGVEHRVEEVERRLGD